MIAWVLVVLSIFETAWCEDLSFPPAFKFGAATASYQVEGAWNISDKSASIWDTYSHIPGKVADDANGDIACDSYNLWETDIKLAKELGIDFYRFSLSWTRLIPTGFSNYISEDGKNYYNKLIDGLLAEGIEPMVTIFHWDLPQRLQDLGGWTNPLITDWFADYARVTYDLFGDRVKTWLTINEPLSLCSLGYGSFVLAPGLEDPEVAYYMCNKHTMLAHAKAWRIYDGEYRPKYHGKVTLANQIIWFESETPEGEELAELVRQNMAGRYSHPIFSKEGGWPPAVQKMMAEKSKMEGYPRSRLPDFTQEEIGLCRGTFDFFALNHYTSRLVRNKMPEEPQLPWPFFGAPDLEANFYTHEDWPKSASFWFYVYPEGIRKQLIWLKEQYGDMEFMITENGYSSMGYELKDDHRVQYYKDYLKQVLLAIKDGVNVTAYTAWTLLDNFEWMDGYRSKFGLYEVDFEDPGRKRTAKKSAKYYAKVVAAHSLDIEEEIERDEL